MYWTIDDFNNGLCEMADLGMERPAPTPPPPSPPLSPPQWHVVDDRLDTPEKIVAAATPEAIQRLLEIVLAVGQATAPAPPPEPPPPPKRKVVPEPHWTPKVVQATEPPPQPVERPKPEPRPLFWDAPDKPAKSIYKEPNHRL